MSFAIWEPVLLTILVTVLGIGGFLMRRNERLHQETQKAMSMQSTALSVLIAQTSPYDGRLGMLETSNTSLKVATAKLGEALDNHQRELDRIKEEIDRRHSGR